MSLSNSNEKSTKIISLAFTDENGDSVSPTSATWTLSNSVGTIINSRENVAISPISANVNICLSGDDLAIGSNGVGRVITVKWVYDSDCGTDLPGTKEETFNIVNLINVE